MTAVKISCMDCMDFLDTVDDGSVDLAVADPPYNIGVAEWDRFESHGDFLEFTYGWIDKTVPKLKKTGSFYVFNTPFNSAYILRHLHEKGMVFQNWITWDKRDGVSAPKTKYSNGQESILFFTRTKKHTFNRDDVRVPYESVERINHARKKGIVKNGRRWFPNPGGKLCGEVWHFSSDRHQTKVGGRVVKPPHRTIKPAGMIERIVRASSNKGDLVMDSFAGSGTTAAVCSRLGRRFVGCDRSKEFVRLAEQRVERENA